MSMYFRDHGEVYVPEYERPGRTKQAFKDDTDINRIIDRFQKTGALSHLNKHEAIYGDFAEFDFLAAQMQLARGKEIFDDLPSELRREFNQSPREFFEFVNDPANKGDLKRIFPQLAKPGRYPLDGSNRTPPGVTVDPDAPDVDLTVSAPVVPPVSTEGVTEA